MRYANYCESYATFSTDKKRRFVLFRQWDKSKPVATVIGLNPSTADDNDDDPTIGFIYRVLSGNGYGGFFMTNLFTMITPHPAELVRDEEVEHAMEVWKACMNYSTVMVFAWGSFNVANGRDHTAVRMFPDAMCFGKLKKGQPRHPMYLKSDTKLIKFK